MNTTNMETESKQQEIPADSTIYILNTETSKQYSQCYMIF